MSIIDSTEAAADALRKSADLRMAVKAGEANLAKEKTWLQRYGVVTEPRMYVKTVDFDRIRKQIEDDDAKARTVTPDDNGGSQAEAMAVNSAVVSHEGSTTSKHSAASTHIEKVAQQQPSV
jgi:tRNA U34 5-carboxymethylaminomethyl modifying enzyme MnmG/GidA